ncbi:MAG: TonB-dependent receptor, partial [Duncaniella sp.]|nr:TonB-dependent receptor [Duncaniella sp.]
MTVLSAADSIAVSGANCRITSEGKFITGAATDANGVVEISTDCNGVLTLNVTMTGYSPTDIIIEAGTKNLSLGTIYLDQGVILDEVTIKENSVIHSAGRTIVFPPSGIVKASSSSLALFQKLPLAGLKTDPINRSLTVDGGDPVITINGVPSNLDEFNAIQPRNILKIEYSRFTPARYADTGKTGLINVILKKRNDGGEISAYGRSALSTTFVDGNILASYHQGASKFSFQYVPSWRNYQKVYDNSTRSYIGDDFNVNLNETDRNPFYYHQHSLTFQYDLSLDERTLFSTSFNVTPFSKKARFLGHTIDSELGEYECNNLSSSRVLTPSLDIFVHKDFNEKNSIEVQVVGTLSYNDYRRDNNYIFADDNVSSYIMDADSRRRSLISEISYSHNFSSATSLSAGYQNTVSRSTNTYLSSDYKPLLTENNNYAYVRLGQRIGAVYLSLSTGAKLFWIKNDLNRRHFIRNLSSAQISWNVSKEWSIVGNFRYSPSIPSLTSLTDYPQQITPYLVSNGNPDLKVAENFNYAVSVNYVNRLFKASFRSSYFNGRNSVTNNDIYLGDRLFLSRSINSRYNSYFENSFDLGLDDFHGFG